MNIWNIYLLYIMWRQYQKPWKSEEATANRLWTGDQPRLNKKCASDRCATSVIIAGCVFARNVSLVWKKKPTHFCKLLSTNNRLKTMLTSLTTHAKQSGKRNLQEYKIKEGMKERLDSCRTLQPVVQQLMYNITSGSKEEPILQL